MNKHLQKISFKTRAEKIQFLNDVKTGGDWQFNIYRNMTSEELIKNLAELLIPYIPIDKVTNDEKFTFLIKEMLSELATDVSIKLCEHLKNYIYENKKFFKIPGTAGGFKL